MSRNKTSAAEKRHGMAEATPAQPPKRSRSVKDRPGTVEQLQLAIAEDRLDLRTRESQQLVAIRDAIVENPVAVSKGAVRDILAMNLTISAAIARQLTKPGASLIDADGNINPLVGKHLEVQKATVAAARILAGMERQGSIPHGSTDDHGPLDVSSIIRDLAEGQ